MLAAKAEGSLREGAPAKRVRESALQQSIAYLKVTQAPSVTCRFRFAELLVPPPSRREAFREFHHNTKIGRKKSPSAETGKQPYESKIIFALYIALGD